MCPLWSSLKLTNKEAMVRSHIMAWLFDIDFALPNEPCFERQRCQNSQSVHQSALYQLSTASLSILWRFGWSWVTLRRPGAFLPVIFSVGDFQPLMCGWCGVMELCIGPSLGIKLLILVTENYSKPIQRHCYPKKMENRKNIICLPC